MRKLTNYERDTIGQVVHASEKWDGFSAHGHRLTAVRRLESLGLVRLLDDLGVCQCDRPTCRKEEFWGPVWVPTEAGRALDYSYPSKGRTSHRKWRVVSAAEYVSRLQPREKAKVYVAGASSDRERVSRIIASIRAEGHEITFDWPAALGQGEANDIPADAMEEAAEKCMAGVRDCDVFVLVCPEGGRWRAEVPGIPGTKAYSGTEESARKLSFDLACREVREGRYIPTWFRYGLTSHADLPVECSFEPHETIGAWIEVGVAMALGKKVVSLGYPRTVFRQKRDRLAESHILDSVLPSSVTPVEEWLPGAIQDLWESSK